MHVGATTDRQIEKRHDSTTTKIVFSLTPTGPNPINRITVVKQMPLERGSARPNENPEASEALVVVTKICGLVRDWQCCGLLRTMEAAT